MYHRLASLSASPCPGLPWDSGRPPSWFVATRYDVMIWSDVTDRDIAIIQLFRFRWKMSIHAHFRQFSVHFWWKSIRKFDRERADTETDARTHARMHARENDFIICPMLCYSYGTDNNIVHFLRPISTRFVVAWVLALEEDALALCLSALLTSLVTCKR